MFLLIADSTSICDFLRLQVPARKVIFVPQLGRNFRLFSSMRQRYESFIAVYEFLPNFFRFFSAGRKFCCALTDVDPRWRSAKPKQAWLCARFAARCSVAVLQRLFQHPKNTSIFIYIIYINIEVFFDYRRIYFGTATLQQLHQQDGTSMGKTAGLKFQLGSYKDANGQLRPCFSLTKTECLYIATKFNDERIRG